MNSVTVRTYGKLNLTLDILGREGDFHMLDSIVCTVDLSDRVTVRRRKDGLVRIFMHGMGSEAISPEENNAFRAAEAFVKDYGTKGADITVHKNIPMGAGLGGSSADAAGTIDALFRLYGAPQAEKKAFADRFGSDTGYLLTGGAARLRGRGERVERIDIPDFYALLVCPERRVSTAECYQKFDELKSPEPPRSERAAEELARGNLEWAARLFGNHLTRAAEGLEPEVGRTLGRLRSLSPLCACMTGSGSACYAVFAARELAEWARSRYRGGGDLFIVKNIEPASLRDIPDMG